MEPGSFAPISTITMTDQVEERLRHYFRDQGLRAGDALPKEIELVEALGVSRSVLREALSRLRMLGMIDARKRRGMVLTEPDVLSGMERLLEPHFLGQSTLKQLFEIRLMLEVGLGDFLLKRITRKDFLKLHELVAREQKAVTKAERLQADILFHSTLYQITGNQTLIRFQQMLLPLFEYITDYNAHLEKPAAPSSVTHADLIGILQQGQAEAFRVAMQQHFAPHYTIIE